MIIKYIITIGIIYFIVRSIANKPWKEKQIHIHHNRTPKYSDESNDNQQDAEYVDYEEVD